MSRKAEFSKETKRQAKARADNHCEAVGEWYGLEPGQRCNALLNGLQDFDHIILEANSHDNSLENCACVCRPCHRIKSAKHDTPLSAKTVRQRDLGDGIKGPSSFPKPPPGYNAWTRRIER